MRRTLAFLKRNALEMVRDPLIYVFCLGFPVLMIVLFNVIAVFANGLNTFEAPNLIPGIALFSFSFVMLIESLLVSKDKSSAFLIRLYTSPMNTADFIVGYALCGFAIGVAQEIVCLFAGWIAALITGGSYFSFGAALVLIAEMLPSLVTFIFFGILFGTVLNDKSAPGICSVVITASGILGGAWMPLDTMGGFETFCRFLPFYPPIYIGRAITGAYHTVTDPTLPAQVYSMDSTAWLGLIPVAVFLCASVVLSVVAFRRAKISDKK